MAKLAKRQKGYALQVLYEDNHLIAVNKHPGEIVQGDKTGDAPMTEAIKEYLKKKYDKPGNVFLGVIHRLDRPVSGVVVFARTSKALARMNSLFQDRAVQKTYWAMVFHPPEPSSGTLTHYLKKNEKQNKSYASATPAEGAKKAELSYSVIGKTDHYHLVEVLPHTGRHHQIRVQLAALGCPIRGDLKYGFPRPNPNGSIHLHARKLEFIHPIQDTPLSIEATPPSDAVWNAIS